MPNRSIRAVGAAALGIGIAFGSTGCGSDDERDEVAGAAREFFDAFADKDGEEICARITAEDVAAVELDATAVGASSCPEAFGLLLDSIDPRELESARDIDIDTAQIEIDGDTATIPTEAADFPGRASGGALTLIREAGDWKVDLDFSG